MQAIIEQLFRNALYGSIFVILLLAIKSSLLKRGSHVCYSILWFIPAFAFVNPLSFVVGIPPIGFAPVSDAAYLILRNKSVALFLIGFWALGTAVKLFRIFRNHMRAYRLTKKLLMSANNEAAEMLEICKAELKIASKVEIGVLYALSSPTLFGVKKPIIVLPDMELSRKELRFILYHELYHLKYRDNVAIMVGNIIWALHWWNPFAYILVKQMKEACELTCDYRVLQNCSKLESYEYAEAMINVVKKGSNQKTQIGQLAFGRSAFERRIYLIINPKMNMNKLLCLISLPLSLLLLLSFLHFKPAMGLPKEVEIVITDDYYTVAALDGTYDVYCKDELVVCGAPLELAQYYMK